MNLRESIPALLLACAATAWPAERISADRLENIVASACSNGTADAQIAHSLGNVELTERLPIGRLESLLALQIGPRTRDVLQMVADASAFLEQPAAQGAPAEAPSDEHRQEMLARAREYTLGYIRALPDFVAFKMTRRFDDYPFGRTEVWHGLMFRDSEAGQLTYNNGVESYVASPDAHGGPGIVAERQGLSSFGEFGSIIGALFWDDSHIQLTWSHWEKVTDKRLAVFHYSIPADHSRYTVSFCCDPPAGPVSVAAAYRGDLFVDPATGGIWRVTREALGLPQEFPTHWAKTIVDYRPVDVAGTRYMLPVRSMTYSETTFRNTPNGPRTIQYWNEVRFVHYRRFAAEARVVTGEQTQAPAEDEAPPEQAPEPWLDLDRPKQPTVPEPPVGTPQASQTGVATIRTSVQLVEVPVIVKDRHGEPVTGMRKEDFEVYDNGVRQDVRVFFEENAELKAVETTAPPVSRDAVFSNAEASREIPDDSTFLLIDTLGMDWAELAYARIEILRFLRNLPETARSHTYLVNGSEFIPLTGQMVNRLAARGDLAVAPLAFRPSGEAAKWNCAQSLSLAGFYMKALAGLAEHLAAIPGRKTVIWVTAAFPLFELAKGESCTNLMPPLVRILNNANVAVYPIDAPGLKTGFADATVVAPAYSAAFAKYMSETHTGPIYANQSTMLELSAGTGGRAFLNANRIASDLQTAFEDTRGSYRLGFYPELHNDGKYHRILVKIADRPELHPRFREWYLDDAAAAEKRNVWQTALDDPRDASGIPLTAELENHGGKCEIKLKIGLAPVAFQEEGERHTGKLEILVAERHVVPVPGLKLKLQQTLGLQLKQETYEQTMRDGFPYSYSFTPKSAVTALRVAVHDPGSGAVGSLTVPVAGCGN